MAMSIQTTTTSRELPQLISCISLLLALGFSLLFAPSAAFALENEAVEQAADSDPSTPVDEDAPQTATANGLYPRAAVVAGTLSNVASSERGRALTPQNPHQARAPPFTP